MLGPREVFARCLGIFAKTKDFLTKAKRALPTLLRDLIKKRNSSVICGEAHRVQDSVLTALHDVYKAQPRKSLREACFSCFASSSSRSSVETEVLTPMRCARKNVRNRRVERDVLKTSPPWAVKTSLHAQMKTSLHVLVKTSLHAQLEKRPYVVEKRSVRFASILRNFDATRMGVKTPS